MISEVEYCSKVCGGKCCYHPIDKVRCIHLNEDKLCSIYERRFSAESPEFEPIFSYRIGRAEPKTFWCGRLAKLIDKGQLDKEVERGCCVAHPELLKDFVMAHKNPIRNEHYEAYKAGKYTEIPAQVLALLDEQIGRTKKEEKKEKTKKDE